MTLQSIRAGEVIISGPSETGKTLAALVMLDRLCRDYNGLQAAMIRKVRNDMSGTVLQTWRRFIQQPDVTVFGGENVEFYAYPNNSRIWIGGMDRPGKVLSGEKDAIYVNQTEELELADWETLSTRVTGRAGVLRPGLLIGDCNPGPPHHWIKSRSVLRLLESRHEDNPMLYDDEGNITEQGKRTIEVLNALTGVRRERLRFGRWVSAEGAVYEFDEAVHLIDHLEPPAEWRRIRVIDFGYTNPFVCQWWAINGENDMFLYREIYMTRRTVRVHAQQINALSAGENIEATIADHDAEDRATLEESGIYTIPADKEISPGIQAVQERLKVNPDTKRSRITIARDALVERDESLATAHKPTCAREEFGVYLWPKDVSGKALKDAPVKLHDHGMDAMRYGAMYVDNPSGADWNTVADLGHVEEFKSRWQ
jgi:phage terminase large subunit